MKKKAILIGNGFTSQVIPSYSNSNLMIALKKRLPEEMQSIEDFFDKFRVSDNRFKEMKPVEILFGYDSINPFYEPETEGVSPWPIDTYANPDIYVYICDMLKKCGFKDTEMLCQKYFFDSGLVYEIYNKNIAGIESPLKIVELAKTAGTFSNDFYDILVNEINDILYHDGDFHLKYKSNIVVFDHTDKVNLRRLQRYFGQFKSIYTTNYDMILDDVFHDKVKHLHGGFCCKSFDKVDYRSSGQPPYILVLGSDGAQKFKALKGARNKTIKYPDTIFMKYLDKLATEDLDELHIFGYSGENDQHINRCIKENCNIKTIIYYCAPGKIKDKSLEYLVSLQIGGEQKAIELRSWDEIWRKII